MNAHSFAVIVEDKLNAIEAVTDSYEYNLAITHLDEYLITNFLTFEETELVYRHAKWYCDQRNHFDNWYRLYGWAYGTKLEAYKKIIKTNNTRFVGHDFSNLYLTH